MAHFSLDYSEKQMYRSTQANSGFLTLLVMKLIQTCRMKKHPGQTLHPCPPPNFAPEKTQISVQNLSVPSARNKWAAMPCSCGGGLAASGWESRCPRAWKGRGMVAFWRKAGVPCQPRGSGARPPVGELVPWLSTSWGPSPRGLGSVSQASRPACCSLHILFAKPFNNLVTAVAVIFTFSKGVEVCGCWRGEAMQLGQLSPTQSCASAFTLLTAVELL